MHLDQRLSHINQQFRANRWHFLFYWFCRLSLAFAFFAAGYVKIIGERFASGLSVLHPMGQYLEALSHTGYYYSFIGWAQIAAALLLLIPRTVLLGALLYFPIILNICILSLAVRFDGSAVTAPLMVLANAYILFWQYPRLRLLLGARSSALVEVEQIARTDKRFPWKFGAFVLLCMLAVVLYTRFGHEVRPANSERDCLAQFGEEVRDSQVDFCACIHRKGKPLEDCLAEFELANEDN